ncbi:MAG: T4-like virus tail tube protein gp19 [bacterium ADurb.Bin429]|nr:MAG: T4-like virus tail tube protein gp19 [bacterium ADurb.Bin429]
MWLLCVSALPLFAAERPISEASNIILMLEGVSCGKVVNFSGGAVSADTPETNPQSGQAAKKSLGQLRFEAITVSLRLPVAPAVQAWITDTWAMKAPRKSGALLFGAADGQITALQFTNALLTEVAISPCDAASDDPGQLTLTIQSTMLADGIAAVAPASAPGTMQKSWMRANFRLALDGMNCADVKHIENIVVRQGIAAENVGGDRLVTPTPGKLTIANLRLTLPAAQAAAWRQWMLMLGDNGDAQEKQGYISLLSADQQTEIQRMTLTNVGVCRIARTPLNSGEYVNDVIVDLYCEQMMFNAPNTPPQAVQPEGAQVPNGKGEFKKTYIMRQGDPLHFTLHSAKYLVEPVIIGERYVVATAGEKLLLLNFTVENPHATDRLVRWDMLRLSAVGAGNVNYPAENVWGIEATGRAAALELPAGEKMALYAVIALPAKGEPTTILVKSNKDNDGPVLPYDAHGHVPALSEPFADPRDATGASALEVVPAKVGTAYPAWNFAVTVDKMELVPAPLGEIAPREDERLFVCELRMRNQTNHEQLLRADVLQPTLTTEEGEKLRYTAMLLPTTDRPVAQPIDAGAEMRVRLVFILPQGAKPHQLVLQEYKSRRYRYLVQ